MFRRFLREGITGWTVLEVPMGDEVFQVHFRKAALRNGYAEADAPAEAASVDEMAELLSFLGGLATSADVISLGMGVAR